ncbi:MAG: hypothetical protein H7336_03700 [Bacteriovorax sp.]|nr:hypothetical protein [Bacteriovorax sp.]
MSDEEEYLEAHRTFLDEQLTKGAFEDSRPKDPFYIQEIALFRITDFKVTKKSPNFTY